MGFDKNGVKTPVCFSEPSAYCCGSHFPYESKLSTESPPHISSGAHATQKNKLAINRDKPLELTKCANNRFLWFMSNHFKKIPSPHIPSKNIEYEQKEKIQHDFLPV